LSGVCVPGLSPYVMLMLLWVWPGPIENVLVGPVHGHGTASPHAAVHGHRPPGTRAGAPTRRRRLMVVVLDRTGLLFVCRCDVLVEQEIRIADDLACGEGRCRSR